MALEMGAVVTGALLTVAFQVVTTRLSSRTESIFMDLRSKLAKAKLLLNDAEDRQLTEPDVKKWLDGLKDVIFRIDDLSDEIGDDDDDHNKQHSGKGYLESCFGAAADSAKSVGQSIVGTVRAEIRAILYELGRLLDLAKDLGLTYRPNMKMSPRDTPRLEERDVFGREGDKKRILELLQPDDGAFGGHDIVVVPIVGMGGIGKTTLAQLVYDDKEVEKAKFDVKAWVTVSTEFDVDKIMKIILQEINIGFQVEESSQLHQKLRDALRGKKFLFVLDDVWDNNYHNWDLLMSDFKLGAPGSRILVTTRSGSVGSVVKTGPIHELRVVPSDESWRIFIQHASKGGDLNAYPELHEVGRNIVGKCKGLPLALKAMGSLLRSERDLKEWENVMNNHVWDCGEKGVLPSLWLSYRYLPSPLKQCFAYCSVFPQDYEFEKEEMVLWWMAEGYLPSDEKESRSMEETGEKYFDDLVSRSLFQRSSRMEPRSSRMDPRFVVHDLVHDLAVFVSGEFCVSVAEEIKLKRVTSRTRHVSHNFRPSDSTKLLCVGSKAKHLRSFHTFEGNCAGNDAKLVKVLTRETSCLRVLSMRYIVPISVSFHNLKHLRYLSISVGHFEELPSSVCSLINLETLLLLDCFNLARLPMDLTKLVKLRHIKMSHSKLTHMPPHMGHIKMSHSKLTHMPPHMGNLKELRTLSNFRLGDPGVIACSCSNINEMQELRHLRGKLSISGLENAHKFEGVGRDILSSKENLKKLVLEWVLTDATEIPRREDKDVLDMLQPHTNLEKLVIKGYQSASSFPSWVGDMRFEKLTSVKLKKISCQSLPLLGQLPSLLKLLIEGFENLPTDCKTIEELEVAENSCLECFPLDQFPKLRKLLLRSCEKLKSFTNAGNSESLTEMEMEDCQGMESFPEAGLLKSLTSLKIGNCSKLMSPQTRLDLQNLTSLVSLSISDYKCDSASMSELFAHELLPNSLASLELLFLKDFKSINGKAFEQVKSLRLYICGCDELESVPEKELLSCLSSLGTRRCRRLKDKYLESKRESYQYSSNLFINRYSSRVEGGTTSLMREEEEQEEYEVRIANLLLKPPMIGDAAEFVSEES